MQPSQHFGSITQNCYALSVTRNCGTHHPTPESRKNVVIVLVWRTSRAICNGSLWTQNPGTGWKMGHICLCGKAATEFAFWPWIPITWFRLYFVRKGLKFWNIVQVSASTSSQWRISLLSSPRMSSVCNFPGSVLWIACGIISRSSRQCKPCDCLRKTGGIFSTVVVNNL